MIEIGTRVTVGTLVGMFTGTLYAYDESTALYTILLDDDGVIPPERRLVGSTTVVPLTEAQT